MKIQRITYLSLGSNLGDRLENLQKAIDVIADKVGMVQQISKVYETASWGFDSAHFLNICVKVSTYHAPEKLLKILQSIEKSLGRIRDTSESYSARTIDIDVLLFDDEIIFSQTLTVPHPKMLERKFVLVPLADIAKSIFHPITKTLISKCLDNCTDSTAISELDATLNRPIPITEKYNYIAIEGNIGAGKTSLSKMMSDEFNAKIVLERFADNPFLPKFYEDQERYAFPLEMSFLADRYQQLADDLAQLDLFRNLVVSDYYIFKSLIFAQITLSKDEYLLYRKMFDLMYKEITKPDLYVYLYQNTERLLANIKKRGRAYEQDIKPDYLKQIHDGYKNFINTQQNLNILRIDVSNLDFVENPEDYQYIIRKIKNA